MSLELIKQFHALAAEGKFDEALALFAEDAVIEFHGPSTNPLAGRYQGRVEVAQFFAKVGASFEIEHFAAEEFIDAGAIVVVLGRERSKVRASGRVFDVPWVQIWRTKEGKDGGRITALTDFFDTGSMAAAL